MKLDLPQFTNEAEEARWWFDHQDEIAAQYARAHPDQFPEAKPGLVAVDLVGEDAVLIRELAALRGIAPHEYAVELLHEALHRAKAA